MSSHLFVIDSSPAIRRLVEQAAKAQGYEVLAFNDGPAAIDEAQRVKPAMIVADYHLEGLTFTTFCDKLRDLELLPTTQLILLTNSSDRCDETTMSAKGVQAFLHKPLQSEEILETIRQLRDAAPVEQDDKPAPRRRAWPPENQMIETEGGIPATDLDESEPELEIRIPPPKIAATAEMLGEDLKPIAAAAAAAVAALQANNGLFDDFLGESDSLAQPAAEPAAPVPASEPTIEKPVAKKGTGTLKPPVPPDLPKPTVPPLPSSAPRPAAAEAKPSSPAPKSSSGKIATPATSGSTSKPPQKAAPLPKSEPSLPKSQPLPKPPEPAVTASSAQAVAAAAVSAPPPVEASPEVILPGQSGQPAQPEQSGEAGRFAQPGEPSPASQSGIPSFPAPTSQDPSLTVKAPSSVQSTAAPAATPAAQPASLIQSASGSLPGNGSASALDHALRGLVTEMGENLLVRIKGEMGQWLNEALGRMSQQGDSPLVQVIRAEVEAQMARALPQDQPASATQDAIKQEVAGLVSQQIAAMESTLRQDLTNKLLDTVEDATTKLVQDMMEPAVQKQLPAIVRENLGSAEAMVKEAAQEAAGQHAQEAVERIVREVAEGQVGQLVPTAVPDIAEAQIKKEIQRLTAPE